MNKHRIEAPPQTTKRSTNQENNEHKDTRYIHKETPRNTQHVTHSSNALSLYQRSSLGERLAQAAPLAQTLKFSSKSRQAKVMMVLLQPHVLTCLGHVHAGAAAFAALQHTHVRAAGATLCRQHPAGQE